MIVQSASPSFKLAIFTLDMWLKKVKDLEPFVDQRSEKYDVENAGETSCHVLATLPEYPSSGRISPSYSHITDKSLLVRNYLPRRMTPLGFEIAGDGLDT